MDAAVPLRTGGSDRNRPGKRTLRSPPMTSRATQKRSSYGEAGSGGEPPPATPWQGIARFRYGLTGKLGWGWWSVGEGDGVPELFELLDEALGASFWIASGEVVTAEVAVGLAG